MKLDPREVCRMTAALLPTAGRWEQGFDPNGDRMCLLHALREAAIRCGGWGLPGEYRTAAKLVLQAAGITKWRGSISETAMAWNDDPERTHAEVLAALRKAGRSKP